MEDIIEVLDEPIKVYAVRNKKGQWFRAKGQGGYGKSWVDDINKAKIYPKSGGARRTVTWFYNNYPEFGACYFVELNITSFTLIDETDILLKKKAKKEREKKESEVRQKEYEIERAQRKLKEAQEELKRLK